MLGVILPQAGICVYCFIANTLTIEYTGHQPRQHHRELYIKQSTQTEHRHDMCTTRLLEAIFIPP